MRDGNLYFGPFEIIERIVDIINNMTRSEIRIFGILKSHEPGASISRSFFCGRKNVSKV